jgi:magnesium-transporting ATPase (P-type)
VNEEGRYTVLGEPTETSIISLGVNVYGKDPIEKIRRNIPIEKIPFEATSKFMATMHELNMMELSEGVGLLEVSDGMIKGGFFSN